MNFILCIVIGALLASTTQAASFDCTKSNSKVEKMICASEVISALDSKLQVEYTNALSQACDIIKLRKSQRRWLMKRDTYSTENDLIRWYENRIKTFLLKNTSHAIKHAVINPKLGKYIFNIERSGCQEYSSDLSHTYILSITDQNNKQLQTIKILSTAYPDNVFSFIDIDSNEYLDLNIKRGYGNGPYPFVKIYRFNKEIGLFKEDIQFPVREGAVTPSEKPDCAYTIQRYYAGPKVRYDYLITEWCLRHDTNRWSEGENCSLTNNKECFQRIDNYMKAWYKKQRE